MVFKIILIMSLFLVVYNYCLYPLGIYLAANIARQKDSGQKKPPAYLPSVSIIIAAYNEERVIGKKLENTLQLDYPEEQLQIIVVSDGSNDDTPKIVESHTDKRIISLHNSAREGKSAAINRAIADASGEILVLSDANNDYSKNAIRELVKHFSVETIGAVTGAKHIYQSDSRESATGDGLYWKYEAGIKKSESTLGSVTAAEGEILAVRRDLMGPIDPKNINDDAAITFDLVKRGYRVIYEENAISIEQASADLIDDYYVKVRMTAGGFQTIVNEFPFLFPPTSWFSFTFLSHKLLRWLTPHFLILIFSSNLFLLDQVAYFVLFLAQILFYTLSSLGWLLRKSGKDVPIFYIPMYFTFMNIALFAGLISYLRGIQGVNWKKASR